MQLLITCRSFSGTQTLTVLQRSSVSATPELSTRETQARRLQSHLHLIRFLIAVQLDERVTSLEFAALGHRGIYFAVRGVSWKLATGPTRFRILVGVFMLSLLTEDAGDASSRSCLGP